MESLPDGFTFERYIDGPGLRFGDEWIAHATPLEVGWRLCLVPAKSPRYEFLNTEEGCIRYMAAWARKYESEIRTRMTNRAPAFAHLATTGSAPEVNSKHPRGRSRRRR